MIKPTKIKNALTVSDADFFSGMWGFEGAFLILQNCSGDDEARMIEKCEFHIGQCSVLVRCVVTSHLYIQV